MFRAAVAAALGAATVLFAFCAAAGATRSVVLAAVLSIVVSGLVAAWALAPHRFVIDESACSRGLKVLSALTAAAALVLVGRLTIFMIDAERTSFSFLPTSAWEVEHSCLTAYYVAHRAARTTPHVYDEALYSLPGDPKGMRQARRLGIFGIDVYEYPPPFLLLPRALSFVTPAFADMRATWFGLNGLVLLGAIVVAAGLLGPAAGTRALLLSPLIWANAPTLSMLQKENVQGMVIAGSILAMAMFAKGKVVPGGALLAFAIVSKLYPGMLAVHLLARRQGRALAWTAAFGAAFSVLSVLVFGWGIADAFLHHLPGLLSGEAFPAFRRPAAMAINLSLPGLAFKAKLFGVPGMGFGVARVVGMLATLATLAVALGLAWRGTREEMRPLAWLSIVALATLCSPFLPQSYGTFPAFWLLTLLAATYPPSPKVLLAVAAGWIALGVYWPIDWAIDPRVLALGSFVPQSVSIALVVLGVRRSVASVNPT